MKNIVRAGDGEPFQFIVFRHESAARMRELQNCIRAFNFQRLKNRAGIFDGFAIGQRASRAPTGCLCGG